jgi:PAS domain S-box-containing protein
MKQNKKENNTVTTISVLAFIEKFSTRLAAITDLETLYSYCVASIKEFFDLDFSTLLLLDDSGKKLVVRATKGFPADMVDSFVLREGEGLPHLALKTGQVEIVEDFRDEDRFEVTPIMAELNVCSAIAAPMMVSHDVFGVLIGHSLDRRHFLKEEKQSYQVIANLAAIAINNASHITSLYNSERKRVKKLEELEEERRKNRELTDEFESIFQTITSGVMLLKDGQDVVRCNEKMADIFGYDSASELCNVSIRKLHLSDEDQREFGRKNYGNLVAGKIVHTDYTLMKKDGTPILCTLSGRAVDQSTPPDLKKGFVWLIDDITRRRAMESEVLQARKLESIGIMAGGIGHDFNNILSAVLGNLELSRRILEPDHKIQELLSSAVEASNRAKDLTTKLLLFTRREGRSVGNIHLQEIFIEYKFEKMLGEKTELQLKFEDDLSAIRIMPDHLKAIIQNLLINADGCMPGGGIICVTAKNLEIDEDRVPGLAVGKYVQIKIADTGSGIEKDILENIFDPYFTTKNRDSSRGSGLGLAIVHSIVKKNYGSITVRSNKEEGTVFTILLPAVVNRLQAAG